MSPLAAVQVTFAVLLIVLIVIQNRGAGLGSAWGGGGESYMSRRGVEKLLFRATILVSAIFVIVSFVTLFV